MEVHSPRARYGSINVQVQVKYMYMYIIIVHMSQAFHVGHLV